MENWYRTIDIRFPMNLLYTLELRNTTLEISPNYISESKTNGYMFSVWRGKSIIRKYNKIFKKQYQAIRYAKQWMKKHPSG